jgi:hypothetical protein
MDKDKAVCNEKGTRKTTRKSKSCVTKGSRRGFLEEVNSEIGQKQAQDLGAGQWEVCSRGREKWVQNMALGKHQVCQGNKQLLLGHGWHR